MADTCGTGNIYEPTIWPGNGQVVPINPGPSVADVIAALADKIEFSHLAQSLRERIAVIANLEAGFTNLNTLVTTDNSVMAQQLMALRDDLTGAVGYINNQVNIEISERQALVNSVNQLVAFVDENLTAALQEESTVRAEQTGALFAEKTIKTDLAGNVSGFGLSAYVDPNGTSSSDFRVAANTFSIAPPAYVSPTPPTQLHDGKVWVDTSGGGSVTKWWNAATSQWQTTPVNAAQPFVYLSTPTTLADGTIVQPGLYVNSASITKLTADQIDTRGLTVKDAQGNVIFGSGTNIDWSFIDNKPGSLAELDAAAAQQLDGKSVTYYQTTAPTGLTTADKGDIWFDTDASYKMYTWTGYSWQVVQDSAAASAAAAAAQSAASTATSTANSANTLAASKITTYYTSSTPYTTTVGDLWYNTSTKILQRWTGSSWVTVSNAYSNTSELYDDALLGSTAVWSNVTGAGKPEDNATAGGTIGKNIKFSNGTTMGESDFVNRLSRINNNNISTFMESAAIGNAYIGNAAVSTLTIASNAVTVPAVTTSNTTTNGVGFVSGQSPGTGPYLAVCSASITLDHPGWVYAASTGYIGYGTGWRPVETTLAIGNNIVSTGGGDAAWTNAAHSGAIYVDSPRTVTATLFFMGQDSGVRIYAPSVFIMGTKR